jgi:hypothetical protein
MARMEERRLAKFYSGPGPSVGRCLELAVYGPRLLTISFRLELPDQKYKLTGLFVANMNIIRVVAGQPLSSASTTIPVQTYCTSHAPYNNSTKLQVYTSSSQSIWTSSIIKRSSGVPRNMPLINFSTAVRSAFVMSLLACTRRKARSL